MNQFKRMTVALMALTLLSTSAFAGGRHHMKKIMGQLDLTDEQVKELKTFRQANKENRKVIKKEMKTLRVEIKKAFKSDASEEKIKQLHEQMKQLRNKAADLRLAKMLKLRSVLTAEQREKFHEIKGEWKEQRKHKGARSK